MDSQPFSDEEILNALGEYVSDFDPSAYRASVERQEALQSQAALQLYRPWLTHRVSPEEFKRTYLVDTNVCDDFRAEAHAFLRAISAEHVMWEFTSPQPTWDELAGRHGYALTLNDEVTHVLIVLVS